MSKFQLQREAWMDFAYCRDSDPSIFVLERGHKAEDAKRNYCDKCPVKQPCKEYGRRTGSVGVWGGVLLTFNTNDITELFPWQELQPVKPVPVSDTERRRVPAILGMRAVANFQAKPIPITGSKVAVDSV